PQQPTSTRMNRPGSLRTSAGPAQPPARKPAASGGTTAQSTRPSAANVMAATPLANPEATFLNALLRASGSASMGVSTASSRMPAAAPKYPTYAVAQKNAASSS